MTLKQRVAAALVAGGVGLSTIGVGTGIANAATSPSDSSAVHTVTAVSQTAAGHVDPVNAQFVDWHGRGPWFRPGPPAAWHPWGWHRDWGWHRW